MDLEKTKDLWGPIKGRSGILFSEDFGYQLGSRLRQTLVDEIRDILHEQTNNVIFVLEQNLIDETEQAI